MDEFPFFLLFRRTFLAKSLLTGPNPGVRRRSDGQTGSFILPLRKIRSTFRIYVPLSENTIHFPHLHATFKKYDPLFRFINQLVENYLGSKGKRSRLVALRSH
jgi:hypothetical protein